MFLLWETIEGEVPYEENNSHVFSQAPTPSPRAPFATFRNEEHRSIDLPHIRCTQFKFPEHELHDAEDGSSAINAGKQYKEDFKAASMRLLTEIEDVIGERSPNFSKANCFFGIPLTDSINDSPRWAHRIIRKSPLEKTEFASESADGSVSNEVDGESMRQVRMDRKSLMALYMELDEERNASAVAANNAMAMITRLQAEKAAVQMEAWQYQRFLEEQAEYDQEALQQAQYLIRKREEEIKALEAELDAYRYKFGAFSEDEIDEDYQEFKSKSYSSCTEISNCISPKYTWSVENLDKRNQYSLDDGAPSSQSSTDNFYPMEERRLVDELRNLHFRVKAVGADVEFPKHGNSALQNGNERETIDRDI
ncbi:hypothetical protein K2173_027325 [Erythroxylum novogranatense]|uniref:GTD-binding domain-containing protein n=1 Tax=Erythroxylum novogranatense TaxID=1862640 RepID=A0AAV8U1A8_9ROSI|nr:hypothetical protein K2173_027325 [Erythroxylum novogranatense]